MKKMIKKIIAVTIALSMISGSASIRANVEIKEEEKQNISKSYRGDYADGQAIIMYNAAVKNTKSFKKLDSDDMKIIETYEFDNVSTKQISSYAVSKGDESIAVSLVDSDKYSTEELIQKLSARSDVIYAEPNYKIHKLDVDPYEPFQWAVENTGQNHGTAGYDINAHSLSKTSPGEKVVAVVDTGIDYTHEDLEGTMWVNPYSAKTLAGKYGYDFIDSDGDPIDDNGHGTHCAGIMKANADNGVGIEGVNQSENIKLMALKILDSEGYGMGMEAVGAYNYIDKAMSLGTNVVAINNSWGGAGSEESEILSALIEIVGEKGALTVFAAGNEGVDNDKFGDIPGRKNSEYVISVAASNEDDELASFSNYGKNTVDIAAPGTNIVSTVSFRNFEPSLYRNNSEVMSFYDAFNSLDYTTPMIRANGIDGKSGKGVSKIEITDEEYFGIDNGSSLKWSVTGARAGEVYYLDLPYEIPESNRDIYAGITIKTEGPKVTSNSTQLLSTVYIADYAMENGAVKEDWDKVIGGLDMCHTNYWTNAFHNTKCREAGMRSVTLMLEVETAGDYSLYIDDLGVSAANISSNRFGKYAFYNGTSMAAPYVTAAVALLADAYPLESASKRRERVLGCTRKSNDLKGKVATGGILDLSKADFPNMTISNLKYDINTKTMQVSGGFIEGAEVFVNDNLVSSSYDAETSKLSFDLSTYNNETVSIKISKDSYDYTEDYYVATGQNFDSVLNYFDYGINGGELVSDGNGLYYVDETGMVYSGDYEDALDKDGNIIEQMIYSRNMESGYNLKLFNKDDKTVVDYEIVGDSYIVPSNQKLYQVLKLDLGYSVEKILASYNSKDGWGAVTSIPEELMDYEGVTLAVYYNVPYLLGGFNPNTRELSDKIYKFDEKEKQWKLIGNLPEERAYAKAIQTGQELIVTLGYDGTDDTPKNLVFKDNQWSVSENNLGDVKTKEEITYVDIDDEVYTIKITKAQTGLVKGGIIYTGINVEHLGDTFIYDVSKDDYENTSFALNNTQVEGETFIATTWRDKLYVLSGDREQFDLDDEDWSLKKKTESLWDDDDDEFDDDYIYYGESLAHMYAIPVEDASIQVKDRTTIVEGYIEGAGGYLPGDTIVLTAKKYPYASESAKITDMIVGDKNIKPDSNGVCTYTIYDAEAGQQINSYIIIAYAEEKDDLLLPVGMKVTKGALTYKITKSSKKNKTVTAIAYKKKKKGIKVSIPATIKIADCTYKVTKIGANTFKNSKKLKTVTIGKNIVSIGKNAFSNCSKLVKVTIKSSKITSFGKGLFKKTAGKLTVKVPKKKLKGYQKKLKKAGFKGKVTK